MVHGCIGFVVEGEGSFDWANVELCGSVLHANDGNESDGSERRQGPYGYGLQGGASHCETSVHLTARIQIRNSTPDFIIAKISRI